MKRFNFQPLYVVSLGVALALNLQCGGLNKKKTQDVENRLKILESKGVPDSLTAGIKVFLYNYATAKKLGNSTNATKMTDSIFSNLTFAEKWYQDFLIQNKSEILSSISTLQGQKKNLSGIHLRIADSISTIIDSLVETDLLIKAKEKITDAKILMPALLKDQETATKLKPTLLGNWKDARVVKADEGNYKYVETTSYSFKPNGTFEGSEDRKGQSSPYFKEDWQFLSWGTYDLKGDTVHLFVNREKCPRQIYTQLNVKDNKWKEDRKATYDSTITDHGKDRSIPITFLKQNYKKSK
jgi:hypothetical protein